MSSTAPLHGRTALVTGSTSGIGLGIAQVLADHGVRIMVNGFGPEDEIARIVADCSERSGQQAAFLAADLSKADDAVALVQKTEAAFGSLDILVNNAGIQHVDPIEQFPAEKWDAVLAINLSSAFHTMRTALPGMKARGYGRIINIASAHGLVASANKAAYVAAKHGLVGLTKVVALETAQTPVTCNAICPGWVLTPLVRKQVEARVEREGVSFDVAKAGLLLEKQPSGEFVTPEQLGGLAAFLCSPAADQIRGAAMNMDGGWLAQ